MQIRAQGFTKLHGVNKGEDKLRLNVNEIIAAAKAAGNLDTMAKKWLERPAGDFPN